jgi:hypothetical protein
MESAMLAAMLLHPMAVLISVCVVLVATVASYYVIPGARRITLSRLVGGYLGALLVVVLICAASSYVSPEEAQAVWKVPPENYWTALWHQFLTLFVTLCYATILGIAVIGAPAIFLLNWRQRATVPWILLVAAIISIAAALLLETFIASRHAIQTIGYLVGGHLLLALGFCLGARLPWKVSRASA